MVNTIMALDDDNSIPVSCVMAGRPNRIKELRAALGWSQEKLAEACKPPTTQPQIQRLEKSNRGLDHGWMDRIAKAFGPPIEPGDLLPESSKMPFKVEPQPSLPESVFYAGATRDLSQHVRPETPFVAGARNLPILGHAKGGDEGHFIDNGMVAGMTYRPHALETVAGGYAVEIWNTSMEPAFKHGCLAFVNPSKQVAPGDDVVVQLADGQALIKQMVRRTESHLILRQHNPPDDIKIARKDVKSIHLIVDATRVRT